MYNLGTPPVLREVSFRADRISHKIASAILPSAGPFPSTTWERAGQGPAVAGPRTTGRSSLQRGFTLIEMIMVLVIMAIMAGLSMPAVESAFTEQAVRKDTHQLALMVKTAMIQSVEQHRPYVIELTASTMALHPEGQAAADPDTDDPTDPTTTPDNNADGDGSNNLAPVDVSLTTQLDPPNQLMIPDPVKADSWIAMPDGTQWVFQPGELCPATRVRLKRGEAYLEMSFSALTGNVENEMSYMP
jgi:prepilin-type N-terminal cleavage/methylation domain-containing protein